MIKLFLNGSAANAGGGTTYLRNVVPCLSAHNSVQTAVAASASLRKELGDLPNVAFLNVDFSASAAQRFWQEQTQLPGLIRGSAAEVLISAGNFALRKSPVPQILLSRNSLYTSDDFFQDLRARREYGLWMDTRVRAALAKRSIAWADRTVAPTRAFAQELSQWSKREVIHIPHGFDRCTFFEDNSPLPDEIQRTIQRTDDSLRLLFVSHYNYYRNFETLLRAVPLLRAQLGCRNIQVFLTCSFQPGANPGSYHTREAAELIRDLGISSQVCELGTIPYRSLHQIYRACDIYVSPAYAESFSHTLVEAMASSLPVVASDLPVHHEICGDAALYFSTFSPEKLAYAVLQACSPEAMRRMATAGNQKSLDYSWKHHVDRLVELARDLSGKSRSLQAAPG